MSEPLVNGTLEISFDPLSVPNASATWTDITDYLTGSPRWYTGKTGDLDSPRAGTAVFPLENDGRFTPEYEEGAYYPNLTTLLRLRWTVEDASDTSPEGIWYVTDWGNDFGQVNYHEVHVTAVDGFGILSLDLLPALDPPDATTYPDVVLHDRPLWYGRLGDLTSATVAAAAIGNEGVYKNRSLLTIGVPGAILGDKDTAVAFATSGGTGGYVEIPLDAQENTLDGGHITVEAWVKTTATDVVFVSGPSSGSGPNWALTIGFLGAISSDALAFSVETPATTIQALESATPANDGAWHHVVGVWRNGLAQLYRDGELVGQASGLPPLQFAIANPKVRIGAYGAVGELDGTVDEVAVYEVDLSAERIQAHFAAATTRGLPAQLAGERIEGVADNGLWSAAGIQSGHHEVAPIMFHSQSRLEPILAAVKAEWPLSLFFFDGEGNPVYLGWEFKADSPYNAVQAVFGDGPGEIGYEEAPVKYDDEIYNVVTISREEGLAQTASDQESIDDRYPRVLSETGLLHTSDAECLQVANAILSMFSRPRFRVETLTLLGVAADAREQILTRRIGDLIRVKRRAHGTNPAVDIVTHILGIEKTMEQGSGLLTATYSLARGFNAAAGFWRAGLVGFSEAGTTTVAA